MTTKKQKELLDFVKSYDEQGISRLKAFATYAKKHNLKPESVRNSFYGIVRKLNLKHQIPISKTTFFSKTELQEKMSKVVNLLKQGHSIRSACLIVSGNDAKQMLRLQNKFRALQRKNYAFLVELGYEENNVKNQQNYLQNFTLFKNYNLSKNAILLTKNDSLTNKNQYDSVKNDNEDTKVLKMPRNNVLSDNDINNLFLGLVKMVKRQAIETAPKILKDEIKIANDALRQALTKLEVSSRKLQVTMGENYELKKKLEQSQTMLKNAKQTHEELLNEINNIGKLDELKSFLQNYKQNQGLNYND